MSYIYNKIKNTTDDFNSLAKRNNLKTRLKYNDSCHLLLGSEEQFDVGAYQCCLEYQSSQEVLDIIEGLIRFVCFENGE